MRFAAALLTLVLAGDARAAVATIWYSRLPSQGVTDGTVWKVNGDGTGDAQVTNGEWPRLSPDGMLVLFHHDAANPSNGNVYVRDLSTSGETKILSNADFIVHYDWSADSTKVVFDSICAIYQSDAEGMNATTLISGDCYDDAPFLNPVDARIAFHNQGGIAVADANGANAGHVMNTQGGDYWAAWSQDGQWLSFGVYTGNVATDYYKVKPDGSGLTLLTPFHGDTGEGYGPRGIWTSDGESIVAPGTVFGVAGLYAIATDGTGTVRRLAISAGNAPDFVGSVTDGTITGDVVLPTTTTTTTTTTSSTSTSTSTSTTTSSSTSVPATTPEVPTTSTTLAGECLVGPTYESILCLLDQLVAEVDAASDLGRLKDGVLKAVTKARKQAGNAATATTTKSAKNQLKKANHTLVSFEHKLASHSGKRVIPAATRGAFQDESQQIRGEIQGLRSTL
jgi:hypothetical protein